MKKKTIYVVIAIAVVAIFALLASIMGGSRIDYPAMLMVDDVLYLDTFEPVTDVQEEDILGYTTSYTKKEPIKNGQANFEKGTAYAVAENGLAVQRGEEWTFFKAYERKKWFFD